MTTNSLPNQIKDIRNIGFFAHIDAGKTTASEEILHTTGKIHRAGRIDDGNTQLDWMEQERNRGITITSAATTCVWNECRINLIDTPGHVDFSSEVLRSIHVIDGAVVLLCGVGGVESQTETIWRYADEEEIPRILFINKLDREAADFERVVEAARSELSPRAIPIYLPVFRDSKLYSIESVISASEDTTFGKETRERFRAERTRLIEALCDTDDDLLEVCIEGEPSEMQIKTAIRRAVARREVMPICCGSAVRGVGIPELLDAIVSYLPSPADVASTGSEESFSVFKTVSDRHIGQLYWIRVFAGEFESTRNLKNRRTGAIERIGGIYRLHANKRERIRRVLPGDVVAVTGLHSAQTGDIYTDSDCVAQQDEYTFPEPIISISLETDDESNAERLAASAAALCRDDPTLESRFEEQTGELVLAGMGELHLEVAIDRIRTEYGVCATSGSPRVSYRETIRKRVQTTGEYRKQSGGRGHFAIVHLAISPTKPGRGIVFEIDPAAIVSLGSPAVSGHGRIKGLLRDHTGSIEKGIRDACRESRHSEYPMTDIKAVILAGEFHKYDTARRDFEIAGSFALREAIRLVGTRVLEPIMQIEASVDNRFLGGVLSDLSRRRAHIRDINPIGDRMRVRGEVPLSETQRYATDIRSLTEGKGTFSLEFARFAPVTGKTKS